MATKLSTFPTNKTTTVRVVEAGHPQYGHTGQIIAGSDYFPNPYFDVKMKPYSKVERFFGWQLEPLD